MSPAYRAPFFVREIATYYAQTEESDATVTVTVETESRSVAVVCSDLDELGVPADEQAGVRDRAIEAYWAAERAHYLQTQARAEGGV